MPRDCGKHPRRPPGGFAKGTHMSELTPREIVAELDKYIIGQEQAKRMVARR